MHCPDCNTEYKCPCPNCRDNPDGLIAWEFLDNGEDQYCSGCGIIRNANEWLDIAWGQYKGKQNGN